MHSGIETVTIEKMKTTDVDDVIRIEESAYGQHHWSKESFLNEVRNELAYYYSLTTSEGKLAGYAGCWHIMGGSPGRVSVPRSAYFFLRIMTAAAAAAATIRAPAAIATGTAGNLLPGT